MVSYQISQVDSAEIYFFLGDTIKTLSDIKSHVALSLSVDVYLCIYPSCFNGLQSSPLYFPPISAVSLFLKSSVGPCLLSACILVTLVSKHISCFSIGFSATRLHSSGSVNANLSQGLQTPTSLPQPQPTTLNQLLHPAK